MKKLNLYILAILVAFSVSCADFLDKYPDNALLKEDTYNSYSDFDGHWMSVYTSLKAASGFTEASRVYGDIQCDLVCAVQGNSNILNPLYTWTFNSSSDEINSIYYAMWTTIGRINDIFDHVPHFQKILTGRDSLNMEELLGDMYFIRALCYSELVKYYCEAYDPVRADDQLGMPIVRSALNVGSPARASLKATYDFMYEDLEEAEKRMPHLELMDVVNGGNYFFTLECVRALWARVALYRGDYKLAAEKAQAALDFCTSLGMSLGLKGSSASDMMQNSADAYAAMFRGQDYSPEVLFFLGMTADDSQGSIGQYFALQPVLTSSEYHPEYVPSRYLMNIYELGDYRPQIIFETHQTDYNHGLQWSLMMKDVQNLDLDRSANSNYQTRPKMFRMSELYLIIAEANAMPGGVVGDGIDALEQLQNARISGYRGLGNISAAQLLEEVKKERVRELCFEGFRLMDLKRWHQGFRRVAQPYTKDTDLVIAADDPRFVWPIPKSELEVNPNMKPNASN